MEIFLELSGKYEEYIINYFFNFIWWEGGIAFFF